MTKRQTKISTLYSILYLYILYPEKGNICIDEGGPTSPQSGYTYPCGYADKVWCERPWFAEKCKQSCGLCVQGKVVLMFNSG